LKKLLYKLLLVKPVAKDVAFRGEVEAFEIRAGLKAFKKKQPDC